MRETTFITELNFQQVDIFVSDDKHEEIFYVDGEEHTYFNAKIHWGLKIYDYMKEMDITPFVDKVEITSGTSVSDNKMIIVKHVFVNITFPAVGDYNKDSWKCKNNFLRDCEDLVYRWHITIKPKFVAVDIDKKIVEIIFNA